jgi:hypothetical protein
LAVGRRHGCRRGRRLAYELAGSRLATNDDFGDGERAETVGIK